MKKAFLFWLAVLLVLPLCACSSSAGAAYTVTRDGREYTVDKGAGTISDGEYTYQYTFTGNAKAYSIEIVYPDGSSWWWEQTEGVGYGGRSEEDDGRRYADGDVLRAVLLAKAPRASGRYAGAGLLVIAAGLFSAVLPRAAWYLGYGWRFRDAEPSELALLANRAGGIVAALAGVVLIFL